MTQAKLPHGEPMHHFSRSAAEDMMATINRESQWKEIEAAAAALLQCVELLPNGYWLVRVGKADTYYAALTALRDLLTPAPAPILEWLLTNGGVPMFAYVTPLFPADRQPLPVAPGVELGRYCIAQGSESYILRFNDQEIGQAPDVSTLRDVAEGHAVLWRASAGDRHGG